MDELISYLSGNYDASEWSGFIPLVKALEYSTPNTFHLFRRLIKHKQGMTHLLLRQTEQKQFDLVWSLSKQMPFEWFNLSLEFWLCSVKSVIEEVELNFSAVKESLPIIDYIGIVMSTVDSRLEMLVDKGQYFSTIVDICKHECVGNSPYWLIRDVWGDNSLIADFIEARGELFSRHEGKVLSTVQTKQKDSELRTYVDRYITEDTIPSHLRGFTQSKNVDDDKRARYAFVLDLPVKQAFVNIDVIDWLNVPSWITNEQKTTDLSVNFALSKLEQFDSKWLNEAMSFSLQAAYIFKNKEAK